MQYRVCILLQCREVPVVCDGPRGAVAWRDEAKLDLNLKPNSPVFGILGFEKIPFDTIGVQP